MKKTLPGEIDTITSLPHYNLSFITGIDSMAVHYHHCYKVVVALDNVFDCNIDGQTLLRIRGIIINLTTTHSYVGADTNTLISFIEADSLLGRQFKIILDGKAYVNLENVVPSESIIAVLPANYTELGNDVLVPYIDSFLNSLLSTASQETNLIMDERVQIALQYIEENIHKTLELKDIANQINLSPERLRRLFVQEVGTLFSQYVIWMRIRKTIKVAMIEENKFNEACLRFGFTDQPHFNKTFKRIFGLTPVGIIRYCRVVL